MTSGDLTAAPSAAAAADVILHHLLPLLLVASLSVKSFLGRWRLLHSKLSLLQTSLSDACSCSHWSDNTLLLDLLPNLLSTLRSLHALSDRCHDPSLPAGKLHLQSDLDIAASSLSIHLHDLDLLLRSGLLHHPHHQPHAIVLPTPGPGASRADLVLFVRDLFARLQIGAIDLKQKALDSLLTLLSSDSAKLSPLVTQEGDIASLVRLLDPCNHSLVRDQAAAAVSILSTASDVSRKAVFEEGCLGPLLRLLETGSMAVKERVAAAIEAITADLSNAWAVLAYNGVPVLIEACRSVSSSPSVQALAAGSLKNVSAVDDIRMVMVEEGALPVLLALLVSGSAEAQRNAALCLWVLASFGDEEIRHSIVHEGGLQKLLQLIQNTTNPEIQEHALRAIQALSTSAQGAKALSFLPGSFAQLAELISHATTATQQAAALVFCNLFPTEENKRAMAGCMSALVKMMEHAKPASAQETATRVLLQLLSVRSNRKELVRDEKSVIRLVHMLDMKREEVCKKYPVAVVLALAAGGSGARRRLAEAGACQHLQQLVDADVAGAKKALQRIAGGRFKKLFSMSWRE